MASVLEEHCTCPVCCDIFKDPVIISCSHSVCKVCLQQFWDTKGFRECPVCRTTSSMEHPLPNLRLKNLCEAFLQEKIQRASAGSEVLCNLHNEKLKLFCLEDKQPVCVVCQTSKLHRGHNLSPTDEAATDMREELGLKLESLRKNRDTFRKANLACDQTAASITTQVQHAEKQIKNVFSELHKFLRDEEAARIAALREEEEQKSQMMKETFEEGSREISFLSDTIRTIEKDIEADDITFLQNYKITVERAQCTLQDPERLSGALINMEKHLGNLKFRVWEKMKEIVQYNLFHFGKSSGFSFSFLQVPCPENSATQPNHDEDEEDCNPEEECDDQHFLPIVPLPELVETATGEEDEQVIFFHGAKLYRFDTDSSEWKDKGRGELKILQNYDTKQVRIIMRRDQVLKLCANHWINNTMTLRPVKGTERAWTWSALDFADGEGKAELLAVRFKLQDTANSFKEIFDTSKMAQDKEVLVTPIP